MNHVKFIKYLLCLAPTARFKKNLLKRYTYALEEILCFLLQYIVLEPLNLPDNQMRVPARVSGPLALVLKLQKKKNYKET